MPPEQSTTAEATLLTGCTGFLGQYILRDLLLDNKKVIVAARGKRRRSALDRVRAIVDQWQTLLSTDLAMPDVISWDIMQSPETLSFAEQATIYDRVKTIVHAGASVRFTLDEDSNEPFRSNVDGTKNVISLAKRIGRCDFHHVSTAYVSGYSNQRVYEQLPLTPQFRNVYEESKYIAECLLEQNRTHFNSLTFYRPSIIVGDSQTGFASSFHTIYLALRLASLLQNTDGYSVHGLLNSMGVSPSISKNIVPVDWVSSSIASTLKNRSLWNKTYHLTNPTPRRLDEIIDAMVEAISKEPYHWRKICNAAGSVNSAELTGVFTHSFQEYFQDDPVFDGSNLKTIGAESLPPLMSKDCLTRLFRYAIRSGFTDSESQTPESVLQNTFDPTKPVPKSESIIVHVHSSRSGRWHPRYVSEGLAREIKQLNASGRMDMQTLVSERALEALESGALNCDQAMHDAALLLVPATVLNTLPTFHSNDRFPSDSSPLTPDASASASLPKSTQGRNASRFHLSRPSNYEGGL